MNAVQKLQIRREMPLPRTPANEAREMMAKEREAATLAIKGIRQELNKPNLSILAQINLAKQLEILKDQINPTYNKVVGTRSNPSQISSNPSQHSMSRYNIRQVGNKLTVSVLPPGEAPNNITPEQKAMLDKKILKAWEQENDRASITTQNTKPYNQPKPPPKNKEILYSQPKPPYNEKWTQNPLYVPQPQPLPISVV